MSVLDRNVRDMIGGLAVAAIGGGFFYRSFAYGIGTLSEMRAGFFPMVLSAAAIVMGLAIVGSAIAGRTTENDGEDEDRFEPRPLLAVLGGIAAFAALLVPFGLGPSVAAAAIIAGSGDPQNRMRDLVLLGTALAIGCWLVFALGLKLPLPFIRGVF